MWRSLLVAGLAVVGASSQQPSKEGRNCSSNTDGRKLACFTCLGRDLEDCEYGLTCCRGSCFKLVDQGHELIVKGCMDGNEEDGSMKLRTLNVPLYWAQGEMVKGQSFFCNGRPYCNFTFGHNSSVFFVFLLVLSARW